MNGLERVLATVEGTPRDCNVVTLTLSLYGSKLIGCPLHDYYNHAEHYVAGQLAVKELFNPDILFTPFDLCAIGEAFGSQARYFEHSPPNITMPYATDAAKVLKIDLEAVESHSRMQFLLTASQKLAATRAHDTAIAGVFMSPIDLPIVIMGIDAWLETVLFNEAEARRIMEMMTSFFVKIANQFLANGAHFLGLPVAFCNPSIVTQRIVKEIALPVLRQALAQIKGPIILHHVGTPMIEFIEMLSSLPNVIGFVIDRHDRFDVARSKVGKENILFGNLDGPMLHKRTPEQLQRHCVALLHERRDDRHFVVASSGPDVSLSTPPENIQAIFQAVRSFRGDAFI